MAGDASLIPEQSLTAWVVQRDRQRQAVAAIAVVSTAVAGLSALLTEALLFTPLIPVAAVALTVAGAWGTDAWWRLRSRWAGHPVVRAEAPWSLAADRALPAGWNEAPLRGSVHRTSAGWTWCPSRLVAADLPTITWTSDEVVACLLTPLWGPGLPESAQLRLYLRGGRTVELVVWEPERITAIMAPA